MRFKLSRSNRSRRRSPTGPISQQGRFGGPGKVFLGLFFTVFLVAGLGVLGFLSLGPVFQAFQARSWDQVPCTVLSSQVARSSSGDGDTYSVDIVYEYEIWGQRYQGDRYDFVPGSSSGYEGKAEVVARHPPGSRHTCRVHPEEATRSVFSTDLHGGYFFGLLGLPFFLVGAGGLWWVVAASGGRPAREAGLEAETSAPASLPSWKRDQRTEVGHITLETGGRRWGRLVGIILVAAFWNGIVFFALSQELQGGFELGCSTLFLIPFVLIGLAMLPGIPYYFLALFNPRPVVTLHASRLRLGDCCQISWSWSGAQRRLSRLRIFLEGQEQATYRRGTDSTTRKEAFARVEVLDSPDVTRIGQGSASLEIPAHTMHSFDGGNNKIVWELKIEGEIARWPDVREDHELVIEPREEAG